MSSIEGVFLNYKFCNQPLCERKDECLRYKRNAPWNVICSVMNRPNCNKGNNYVLYLEFPPEVDELPEDYFGYKVSDNSSKVSNKKYKALDVIKKHITKDTQFYIEPFVANSKTVYKIKNVPNIFGTDTNKEALDKLIKKYNLNPKHFIAYDYSNWDKVLLNTNYQNKCLVYCDVPDNIDSNFYTKAKTWSEHNIVLLHTRQTLDEYKESFELDDNTVIYRI